MLDEALTKEFIEIGRDMFLRGLVSSHAGNMSVRTESCIYITRRGAMLGRLSPDDIVEVDIGLTGHDTEEASSEYLVHRAIYLATDALAVVHAHPPYGTLLSMFGEIVPVDSEGLYHLKRVPVTTPAETIASPEAAELVSAGLKESRAVLVRGHGTFTRGATLEEAYMLTSTLESSAFYLYHLSAKG